jgi:dolichyl-phosphate-mannose-protein mannosyltransferase
MTRSTRDTLIQILLFLATFSLYLKGLCPTVFVGDSGELTTTAHVLGIAHPSGYPLYVLLLKAFFFLPLDNIAARANLFSAVCFSLAMAQIYRCGRMVRLSPAWLALAIIPISATRMIWEEATVTRVYGLNILFLVLFIHLALIQKVQLKHFLFAAFLGGLVLGNHIQILFTVTPVLLIIFIRMGGRKRFRNTLLGILCFIFGVSVYLELPIRSHGDPAMNWGKPDCVETFVRSVTRSTFWYKAEGLDGSLVWKECVALPGMILRQMPGLTAVLACLGCLLLFWVHPSLGGILILTAVSNLAMLLLHGSEYDLFQTDRYHLPLVVCLLAGVPVLLSFLFKRRSRALQRIAALCFAGLSLMTIVRHFAYCDRSQAFIADDFAFNIEMLLPPDACMFLVGDTATFSMAYRHYVEVSRPDITLIQRTISLFRTPIEIASLPLKAGPVRGKLEKNIIKKHGFNVFTIDLTNVEFIPGVSAIPIGFIHKFVPNDWRFQADESSDLYFRNRWVHAGLAPNSMIELLNILYRRGATHRWVFLNSIEKAEAIREKISSGSETWHDYYTLATSYRTSGLRRSAAYVERLGEKRFPASGTD